jgi:hypothetical protein
MAVKLTQNQGYSDPAATKATMKASATKRKNKTIRSDPEYPKREQTTQRYDAKRIFH